MQVTVRESSAGYPASGTQVADDHRHYQQQQSAKPKGSESQLKFVRPYQMALFSNVTSCPPLGQVTCLRRMQKAKGSEAEDTVSVNSLALWRGQCI